jgi:phage head maturation protease
LLWGCGKQAAEREEQDDQKDGPFGRDTLGDELGEYAAVTVPGKNETETQDREEEKTRKNRKEVKKRC